jgi:hypothetical protein
MAQLNFDATQVEPDTGFDTVPAGWYNVSMDESDLKPTKDGAGTYLQARFNILDGQYRGRKLFTRLNIRNANSQAQEIALRQLSAIGHAVGVLHIQDSQQLHGLPLKVKVKIRKGDDNYEDSNEIISYKNINEPVETVGGAGGAPQGQMPPQGFQAPPQQPQGFQQPPQQQFAPPQQAQQPAPQQFQQQAPVQQFQQPPVEQPQQPGGQQPWAQPPLQTAPPPQQDPSNPFQGQGQQQPNQQQPWNGGQAPQQGQPQAQQQPQGQPDPHAAAAQTAQQAPPPWANQGQPQG